MCKANNVKLVFITTPNFRRSNPLFEKRMKEFAGNDIPVYKYNKKNPIYYNKDYFYDESHLNTKGAKIFTHEIALFLKDKI